MTRALAIFVVVWGLLLAAAAPGHACSCGPDYPPTPLEQYAAADAAFTGTVIDIAEDQTFPAFNNVTILVTGIWKGISTSIVHVLTSKTDGGCGVFFVVSDEYLIYAYDDRIYPGGPWSTDSCTRTSVLSSAQEDLDALGPPGPVPVSSVSWGIVKAIYDD